MKAEKVLVEKENDKKEKSFDGMYAIFDNTKTDDEIETVDQLTERKIDKKTQQEFKDKLRFYIGETDKYRTSSVLAEVLYIFRESYRSTGSQNCSPVQEIWQYSRKNFQICMCDTELLPETVKRDALYRKQHHDR